MISMWFVILFFLNFINHSYSIQFCYYDSNTKTLSCENFLSFADLGFRKLPNDIKIKHLSLNPAIRLDLNATLSNELFEIDKLIEDGLEITLKNINSFDILFNSFANLKAYRLNIDNSTIKLRIGNQDLNDCKLSTNPLLFRRLKQITFGPNVEYIDTLCPVLFYRIQLELIEFSNLNSQSLKFANLSLDLQDEGLDSNIQKLLIENSSLDSLDSGLLSKQVFEKVKFISYSSDDNETILTIEDNVFEPFTDLNALSISLYTFTQFVQNSSLLWLNTLNPNSGESFRLILKDISELYDYPDDDFCLFYEFPHERNVFPIIHTGEITNCSCTLLWLLKESVNSSLQDEIMTQSVMNCYENNTLIQLNCSLDERIEACKPESTTTTTTPKSTTIKTTQSTSFEYTLSFITPNDSDIKPSETYSIVFGIAGIFTVAVVGLIFFYLVRTRRVQLLNKKQKYEEDVEINQI